MPTGNNYNYNLLTKKRDKVVNIFTIDCPRLRV